jgi:malonate transporter and related proteins
MLDSIAIVLPVFGLIAIGYGARRFGLLGEKTGEGLSNFVFTLAVPCLIFRTLARAELPSLQPWGYWIAYFVGVAIVWLAAMFAAKRLFGSEPIIAVVAGFCAGQSNTVLVGIPLILSAYGEAGAVPLFLLLAIHLPVTMTTATILAERGQLSVVALLQKLITHPIIIGVLAGSAARFLPVNAIPAPAWQIIDMLAGAAIPCALVGMGIALRRYGLQAGWRLPLLLSVLKLIIHPLIVLVLAIWVFALPPTWTGVAVLFAASPCGINAYLFAERYNKGVAIASSAIALSTTLALATTIMWLAVLKALL